MTLTTTEYAMMYMGLGERPVPIPSGEKGPKIQEWTTKQFGPEDFGEKDNIGLRLGPNAEGKFRFALDFDYDETDPDRYAKSKAVLLLLLGKTMISKGRRGFTGHAIADEPIKNHEFVNLQMDLLSDGKQTVVAPSIANLVTREWEPDLSEWSLPTIRSKELFKTLELSDTLSKYVKEDGTRNKISLGLRAFVRQRELDVELFKKALVVALMGTDSKNIEDHIRVFDQETGTEYSVLPKELYVELDKQFRVVSHEVIESYGLGKGLKIQLVRTDWGNEKSSYRVRLSGWNGHDYSDIYFERDLVPTVLLLLKSINEELKSIEKQETQ